MAWIRAPREGDAAEDPHRVRPPGDPRRIAAPRVDPVETDEPASREPGRRIRLSDSDAAMLDGRCGDAAQFAMEIVVRMAEVVGAEELLSIEAAHIDACALMAPSSRAFIEGLVEAGGRVRVPTTLNMVSLDLRGWQRLGVPETFARDALRIADAYLRLGCIPTWTCAPYQGYRTPRYGQQIAWGESNAVAYANSVLGARTNRYADYLDVCAAVTGRVPKAGLHCPENRLAQCRVVVRGIPAGVWDEPAAWAAFGHWLGTQVGERIPAIEGLPPAPPEDGLKAFAAAAASAGSVALFHAVGITPEAPTLAAALGGRRPDRTIELTAAELRSAWEDLSPAPPGTPLDAVIVGCPHASYAEFDALASEIREADASIAPGVQFLVFTHAGAYALAERRGHIAAVERFGGTVVQDTCPFHSPVVRGDARTVMTDSGKCAYYAPGELGVDVAFDTVRGCVRSAARGAVVREDPPWRDG